MTDNKMTESEVMEALKICTTYGAKCTDCPAYVKVDRSKCKEVLKGAVEIINRKNVEIDFVKSSRNLAEASVNTLKAELDLAKAFHKEAVSERDLLNIQLRKAKAENEALYKINAQSTEEISELRKELCKRQNLEESFSKAVKQFDKRLEKTVKLERAEAYREFAKFLIDKAENGVISIADLPEYTIEMEGKN